MLNLPELNRKIKLIIDEKFGGNVKAFADFTGLNQQSVNRLFNLDKRTGKYPDAIKSNKIDYVGVIINKFPDVNSDWINGYLKNDDHWITMAGKPLDQIFVEEPSSDYSANGRLIEKPFTKTLIKLPVKAQFGLKEAEFPEVYLDQLEKYEIQTEENWNGRYFDIEGEGESMVCDDPQKAIFPGDEIRVREIRWDLYANSKLHIHDYPEFAFFHRTKGICIKHVLEHNVEERRVLLHSYNPDKERYPDEWISLNDCYIVANVVSVTRNRGFNRKIKKLSGR